MKKEGIQTRNRKMSSKSKKSKSPMIAWMISPKAWWKRTVLSARPLCRVTWPRSLPSRTPATCWPRPPPCTPPPACPSPLTPFQYGDGDGLERPSTSDRPISQRWTSQSTVNLEACHPPQPSDLEPALSHAPSELQAPPKTPSPVCPA